MLFILLDQVCMHLLMHNGHQQDHLFFTHRKWMVNMTNKQCFEK